MSKFRIVTPKGASFTVAGGGYGFEKEALDPIGAEIVEAPANRREVIAAARNADAIYAKGMPITKTIIDALENCKVITLGSVGVDSVDVKAATARGIPVTNIPDTFIEEVADHAMMLLLAGFRRLVAQDKMVREKRWSEGRPALLKIPRLMGQTLGFISFGRVARAVAKRAAPFGLRMMAYDPFIQETLISEHGVIPATLSEVLSQSDFVSMHAPARPEVHHMLGEKHFRQMKPSAVFINTGRGATVDEEALIKALQEGWIAHAALGLGLSAAALAATGATAQTASTIKAADVPAPNLDIEKGASLRMLRPVRFVKPDEDVFRANAAKFTEKTGVEVKVDFVGWEDINQQTAVTSNSGAGPDIITGFSDAPHIYVDKLIELTDVAA